MNYSKLHKLSSHRGGDLSDIEFPEVTQENVIWAAMTLFEIRKRVSEDEQLFEIGRELSKKILNAPVDETSFELVKYIADAFSRPDEILTYPSKILSAEINLHVIHPASLQEYVVFVQSFLLRDTKHQYFRFLDNADLEQITDPYVKEAAYRVQFARGKNDF